MIRYRLGYLHILQGKAQSLNSVISESVEVQLIRLSYCKISPYWHLVTAVTVTVVTKVSYV
jgi:hypothetical protein